MDKKSKKFNKPFSDPLGEESLGEGAPKESHKGAQLLLKVFCWTFSIVFILAIIDALGGGFLFLESHPPLDLAKEPLWVVLLVLFILFQVFFFVLVSAAGFIAELFKSDPLGSEEGKAVTKEDKTL